LTTQLTAQGLEVVVVGRDGRGYSANEWPNSKTFRSAEQGNLLVADNRTRQYADADEELKQYLRELAWGPG
jgi:hypothetical protein